MATHENGTSQLDPSTLTEIDIEALDDGPSGAGCVATVGTATCPACLGTYGSF